MVQVSDLLCSSFSKNCKGLYLNLRYEIQRRKYLECLLFQEGPGLHADLEVPEYPGNDRGSKKGRVERLQVSLNFGAQPCKFFKMHYLVIIQDYGSAGYRKYYRTSKSNRAGELDTMILVH